ncbi:MAG: DUF1631 family protein [Gammaproteobacteria bacterium]|nr:DUF1631 family protein [Gammaproteobacteria bacterium]
MQKTGTIYDKEIKILEDIQTQQIDQFGLPSLKQNQFLKTKSDEFRAHLFSNDKFDILYKYDLIDLMFLTHVEHYNLPMNINMQIGLLKIISLRLAILDTDFFLNTNNPVVHYLETTSTEVSKQLNPKNEENFQQLLAINVQNLIRETKNNKNIFSQLIKNQSINFKKINSLKLKSTQELDDQQLSLSKQEIIGLIKGYEISADTQAFLIQVWSKVLASVTDKNGVYTKERQHAIKTVKVLIWSLQAKQIRNQHRKFIHSLIFLFNSISSGLKRIEEYDSYFRIICDILTTEHAVIFKTLFAKPYKGDLNSINTRNSTLLDQSSEKVNAEFEEANDSHTIRIDQAKMLIKGEWLELHENKKMTPIKLTWKAKDSSEFIFVNSSGVKVKQCSLLQLVADLENDIVRTANAKPATRAHNLSFMKQIGH